MNNTLDNKICIILPAFNEEENIKKLAYEIDHSLKNYKYEVIFVDDGSNDNTKFEILNLNELKQVRLISHKKCYGQSVAMRTGILNSKYNIIATLDGDGQNDPSDIPKMIEVYKKNKNKLVLVAGIRSKRKDSRSIQKRIDDQSTIESTQEETSHPDTTSYQHHQTKYHKKENINQYTNSFYTAKHVNRNPSGRRRLSGAISPLDAAFSPGCNKGI